MYCFRKKSLDPKKTALFFGEETEPESVIDMETEKPALYIIATPIGNLGDISHRALRLLGELEALACEDTRVTPKILARYGIKRPRIMFSYHEHNEMRASGRVLDLLSQGMSVGLCSNAGTPGISDPGFRAIRAAIENGFPVVPVPGASAVTSALVASGLPASSYTFLGFPSRKSGKRLRMIEQEAESPHTLIFYESPHRLGAFLADAFNELGDRRAAVAIELTKKFEEIHHGWLGELAELFANEKVRGEVTVVIAGNNPKFMRQPEE